MRRLFCILAAATFAPAVYAAPADDALDRQRSNDDPALFRGSSAQPPEDVFLVKRDGTSELAGVSVPLLPGLLGGGIEARQQQQCPYPVMCSARSCCPAGYKCVRFFILLFPFPSLVSCAKAECLLPNTVHRRCAAAVLPLDVCLPAGQEQLLPQHGRDVRRQVLRRAGVRVLRHEHMCVRDAVQHEWRERVVLSAR